jgi:hypothetical protein
MRMSDAALVHVEYFDTKDEETDDKNIDDTISLWDYSSLADMLLRDIIFKKELKIRTTPFLQAMIISENLHRINGVLNLTKKRVCDYLRDNILGTTVDSMSDEDRNCLFNHLILDVLRESILEEDQYGSGRFFDLTEHIMMMARCILKLSSEQDVNDKEKKLLENFRKVYVDSRLERIKQTAKHTVG